MGILVTNDLTTPIVATFFIGKNILSFDTTLGEEEVVGKYFNKCFNAYKVRQLLRHEQEEIIMGYTRMGHYDEQTNRGSQEGTLCYVLTHEEWDAGNRI